MENKIGNGPLMLSGGSPLGRFSHGLLGGLCVLCEINKHPSACPTTTRSLCGSSFVLAKIAKEGVSWMEEEIGERAVDAVH